MIGSIRRNKQFVDIVSGRDEDWSYQSLSVTERESKLEVPNPYQTQEVLERRVDSSTRQYNQPEEFGK